MPIALDDDRLALASVARAFLAQHDVMADAHRRLDAPTDTLPEWWADLAALGWLGLHVPEQFGGQGYGLLELAVVAEELGRVAAPGPFMSTTAVAAAVATAGTDDQRAGLLPGLVDGSTVAALDIDGVVMGAAGAHVVAAVDGSDVLVFPISAVGLAPVHDLDGSFRLMRRGSTSTDGNADVVRITGGAAECRRVAAVVASAQAAGGAAACTEMAVGYAKDRVQFGRVIGSFQAIKHHCAEMLVGTELGVAAVWNAAQLSAGADGELAGAVAVEQAIASYRRAAEKNLQIHGGIGYTWEHACHLHLRRAATLVALFPPRVAATTVFDLTAAGATASARLELPADADEYRTAAVEFRERFQRLPHDERRTALIESGYFFPHWPRPWGRGAGPVEQIVIEEELADVEIPNLGIGAWVLLTLVQCASPDQAQRWIRPSLDGDLQWCQLFSEPNAGSDAAAISTRATRVDGGWLVNGQKVWTSNAQHCNRGLATVRTDPDAPKHAGVTAVAVDLGAPGVEIRPLREITGETLFNEVFFTDVFVPDDDVVGVVNQGWTVARATLGNERVSIGGAKGSIAMLSPRDLIALAGTLDDRAVCGQVGALVAEENAMSALNLRHVARSLIGGPPGPEGNVTKMVSAELTQKVSELALEVAGRALVTGDDALAQHTYLFSRCLTIAGGTSEIVRNIIAERLLGLPRDPLAK